MILEKRISKKVLNYAFYSQIENALLETQNILSLKEKNQTKQSLTSFPKKCPCCEKVFASEEDFLNLTQKINEHKKDDITIYKTPTLTKIIKYRNCPDPCKSTLVIVDSDRRDVSLYGVKRRACYDLIYKSLGEAFKDDKELNEKEIKSQIALYFLKAITEEKASAQEAYALFRYDISNELSLVKSSVKKAQ